MTHSIYEEFFMRLRLVMVSLVSATIALAACSTDPVAQFWRPISEPNTLLPMDSVQQKLEFDLSQCHCGIYPANAAHDQAIQFQPDRQRMTQTGVVVTPDEVGQCVQKPSLVVTECMRQRGWEPTNCTGRMPTPGGGSLCAAYAMPK